MSAAYPGDIVFSKIDARNGAIGVIPSDISQAVVTSEFPVFTPIPDRFDGEFVKLVLRSGGFLSTLRAQASGTSGRKRITAQAFLDLHIPLPSLDEQRAIVASYQATMGRAADLEREADETEAQAMEAFEAALGFGPPTPLPDRPVFIASFNALDRWSHEGLLRRIVESGTIRKLPYPIVQLRDVIADLENGQSPKCYDRPAQPNEWGVLKVSAASSGSFREAENKALPKNLQPKKSLEVRVGEILITRASGVARLVGVTALVENTRNKLMICDKLFRVVEPDNMKIDHHFIAYVLGINYVREQIEREFSTKSGMMKNISKPALMNLTFPLPPKDEQVAMTTVLVGARAKAAILREQARRERAQAWTIFDTAVYVAEDDANAAPDVVCKLSHRN